MIHARARRLHMRTSIPALALGLCLWLLGPAVVQAVELQWWSHWAVEDSKKTVLFEAKRRFEARKLGITVPASSAFTQEQFKDVVGKCAKGGYAAFATGASDRDWAAHYIPNALLNDKLGADELLRLFRGEISWKDPRVVEVFHYYKE